MRRHFTYANVMSTIGVFIALGGTSYAVARNSIGTPQLRDNAVTSAKVRNGALTAKDLAASVLGSVARGPRGPEGPTGLIGPTGAIGPIGPPGPAAAEGWDALPFMNGWTNYGGGWEAGGYRKDQLGLIHLRGLITHASGVPSTSTIFVLPPGYRPQHGRIFAVQTGEPAAAGRLDVHEDGEVVWNTGAVGESDFTSLDGVAFDTD